MIYPEQIADYDAHAHYARHHSRGRTIYLILLAGIVASLATLPWIRVEIGIRAAGMIRPETDALTLLSPAGGIVERFPFGENSRIAEGDTIAVIRPEPLHEELKRLEVRYGRVRDRLSDLGVLMKRLPGEMLTPGKLRSEEYLHALFESVKREELANRKVRARQREYERIRRLVERQMDSPNRLEEAEYSLRRAVLEEEILHRGQYRKWSEEKERLDRESGELGSLIRDLERQLEERVITAPVQGSLQSLAAVGEGSYITSGQTVARISPDSEVLAELHIPPDRIGLIRNGMPVRIRVDSFDHREWGILTGTVTDISDDILPGSGRSHFTVLCRLDRTWLELPGGFRGDLRKGMTLHARLIVSERSLARLLFDRVEDWLNPNWSPLPDNQLTDSITGT